MRPRFSHVTILLIFVFKYFFSSRKKRKSKVLRTTNEQQSNLNSIKAPKLKNRFEQDDVHSNARSQTIQNVDPNDKKSSHHQSHSDNVNNPTNSLSTMQQVAAFESDEFTASNLQKPLNDTCRICLEPLSESPIATFEDEKGVNCRHGFHEKCATEALASNSSCPICRIAVATLVSADGRRDAVIPTRLPNYNVGDDAAMARRLLDEDFVPNEIQEPLDQVEYEVARINGLTLDENDCVQVLVQWAERAHRLPVRGQPQISLEPLENLENSPNAVHDYFHTRIQVCVTQP
jgi:hypothetical protein